MKIIIALLAIVAVYCDDFYSYRIDGLLGVNDYNNWMNKPFFMADNWEEQAWGGYYEKELSINNEKYIIAHRSMTSGIYSDEVIIFYKQKEWDHIIRHLPIFPGKYKISVDKDRFLIIKTDGSDKAIY